MLLAIWSDSIIRLMLLSGFAFDVVSSHTIPCFFVFQLFLFLLIYLYYRFIDCPSLSTQSLLCLEAALGCLLLTVKLFGRSGAFW